MSQNVELGIVLTADGKGLTGELKVTEKQLKKLKGGITDVDKSGSKATKSMARLKGGMGGLRSSVAKVARSMTGLGALFTGLSAVGLGATFISAASTAEKYKVRLNNLLGSQAEGNRLFKEMAEYASKVPFEYEKVMESATQLAGVMRGGVDEIAEWMPLIGDLAAVSGLEIQEATEQVARMLSVGAQSAEKFKDKGINAMLGFQSGVAYTADQTRQMLLDAWNDPASKFKGTADDLGQTWSGMLSMLADKWFQVRTTIMDGGLFDYLKELVTLLDGQFNEVLDESTDKAEQWSDTMIAGIDAILMGFAHIGDVIDVFMVGVNTIKGAWLELMQLIHAGNVLMIKASPSSWFTPNDENRKLLSAELELYKAQAAARDNAAKSMERITRNLSEEMRARLDGVRASADARKAARELAGAQKTLNLVTEKGAGETQELTKEEEALAKAQKSRGASLEKSLMTPMEEYIAGLDEVSELLTAGAISAETAERQEIALGKAFEETTAKAKDQVEEIFNLTEAWRQVQKNLQNGFSDLFVGMFHGDYLDSIKDFGKQVLDIFLKLIADIAAAWVASKIFGGSLGLGGLTGGAGAGGVIGGVASAISGAVSSIGAGIAGLFGGGAATAATSGGFVAGTGMGTAGTMGGTMVAPAAAPVASGAGAGLGVAALGVGAAAAAFIVASNMRHKESAKVYEEVVGIYQASTNKAETDMISFGESAGKAALILHSTTQEGADLSDIMAGMGVEFERGANGALLIKSGLDEARLAAENFNSESAIGLQEQIDAHVRLNAVTGEADDMAEARLNAQKEVTHEWQRSLDLVNGTKFDGIAAELQKLKGISSKAFKAISKDGIITANELASKLGWSADKIKEALGGAASATVTGFLKMQGAAANASGRLTGEFKKAGEGIATGIESGVRSAQGSIDGMHGADITNNVHTNYTSSGGRPDVDSERAEGGMVSSPEVALIGEDGRELVLPNSVTEFFVKNGVPINSGSGGGKSDDRIVVRLDTMVAQNAKIFARLVDVESAVYQTGTNNVNAQEGTQRAVEEIN